jgi:hypothetical protein
MPDAVKECAVPMRVKHAAIGMVQVIEFSARLSICDNAATA